MSLLISGIIRNTALVYCMWENFAGGKNGEYGEL